MSRMIPLLAAVLAFCGTPAQARVLRVSDDISEPLTLDPQKQFSEKNHTICQQIFEGLIRFDPDGRIEPALAVSWRRVDPLRMRFSLRKGVYFHNGEPFGAAAVKFSVERYLDPATGFPTRLFIDSIAGAEFVDENTVDIVTRYPDGLLLNRLAGFVLVVPPKYLAEKGAGYFAANPVGTGAFVFEGWDRGKAIRLSANRAYWMKGYPKLEGIEFRFLPPDKQLEALLAGELDLITNVPGTQTLRVKTTPGLTVTKKPSFYTMPFSLNVSSGPLRSRDVRLALNYAVDKDSLIRYDILGNGSAIATFSMPGETGHNGGLRPYRYDPARAKRLLARAGYPGGFTLKALVKLNAERTAKIVARGLEAVGVKLEITLVSDADSIGEFSRGAYDIAAGDVPDPMCHAYFIQAMLLSSHSPYCLGADPKVDALLGGIVGAIDEGEAARMTDELDRYIHDEALGVFTYQKTAIYGMKKNLAFSPYRSRMPYFYAAGFDKGEK